LFAGRVNPLRYQRLSLYRITLPEPSAPDDKRWNLDIDLGVIARSYTLPRFVPETWLSAPDAGLGSHDQPIDKNPHLYVEVAASSEALLKLSDSKTGRQYIFDLSRVTPGRALEARPTGSRVEILEQNKVWLHGQVVDTSTHQAIPVRLAFRSKEGRYLPPYGHRAEINDGWFQDYGADVKLMDTSFAYVDGTFQVELPVGEIYLEMTKGFEYQPVRKKLTIQANQRELNLEIARLADFRTRGWVSADTHVHFLSPSTAVLEGQAEGLNLVNLLAAQWGDLFTNVGDLSHGPLSSSDGQMIVWVGTENRQHLLGHLGLLGGHGWPVFPMSAAGPGESYLGDPLWNSLSDWTDNCRQREGLVVAVHFPYPTAELAADIVLGKIDAVELYPYGEHFSTLRFLDWYRYLNCGYRLPAVGGTDKMGAYMPVGANRTYAYLGQDEFSFANFAKAVRSGNTFMTTGPLIFLQVDGQMPGSEIKLGSGGGSAEVLVEAKSFVPFHRLEVVSNGRVVASREETKGTREMTLREKLPLTGPGWMAARCASRFGPTTAWTLGIQAHTSPVYVVVPGQEPFSVPAATYFLTLIDGAEQWVKSLATRPDADRLKSALKVFADAREQLHRKMHEHEIRH
ncbi:MAG TPA: CehA/McbA family metallohydrolase, partial [Terriglobia bacterium]|nr:CehA/McbA family metallohydrolase [Terriglobia bacterium]